MRRSTDRILTTHTGSLPRPPQLVQLLYARERGDSVDEAEFEQAVRLAVRDVVAQQVAAGVSVVNDGEMSKVMYSTYVATRVTGFEGEAKEPPAGALDLDEHPEWTQRMYALRSSGAPGVARRPACTGPIQYWNTAAVERDIANLKEALVGQPVADAFLSAASPGVVSIFLENQYYPNHEAYVFALADAMKTEYDLIARSGLTLQIDCPDLAMGRHSKWRRLSFEEFRQVAATNVEALNHALRDIPPEQVRIHLCWGNYEGPHTHDVPLRDILDLVFRVRATGISFEAANPRHAHEWAIWEEISLPEGKVLIPGVLDSTTNFVEHPELVCQRIVQFARLVGRENVIAGTDCGFSTAAGAMNVVPSITWAKFRALSEGAALATRALWE
ncbi:MAG: cobalamin-independent methionine synthase II family protein [Chloroflexi bacterium]|nr:cobalamin-independent methionine synthase II family protein [Chloroflexota bacterium]